MIYFVIALFFLVSIFLFEFGENKKASNFFYWTECAILIALAGLRNYVGGDTIGYMEKWYDLPTIDQLGTFKFSEQVFQPFWYVFNAIVKYINDDFTTFQIIHAVIINISIFIFIKKHTNYRFTAVLLYYIITFLNFNTEVLRESLAISVFLFAFPEMLKKKWLKYYLLATLSFLFHSSSIILFFLPFLRSFFLKEISVKRFMYFFVLVLIIANQFSLDIIINTFFPFLKIIYKVYSDRSWSVIGYVIGLINILVLLAMIIMRQKKNVANKVVDTGLKIYLFFLLFTLSFPIAQRFLNYFVLFFILALTDVFWKFKRVEFFRKKIIIGFFVCSTFQYYYTDMSEFSGVESRFVDRYFPYYSVYDNVTEKDIRVRKAIYLNEALIEF